jgi:DNA-binding transcriptional LysR family regulator
MIDKLEVFLALARERHFGRAAESLGITQPSVSSAIRQLEESLGVPLVHRGSRFLGLTPEGQRVLEHAQRISRDVRLLRDEMRAVRSGLSGNLRLGVIPTALPRVAALTAAFLADHPRVRVTVLSRTSAEILAGIEALTLDAGITYLDNEPLGRVAAVPLYSEFYRFICAPGSRLAGRAVLDWADLAGEPLCLLSGDMQNRRIVNEVLAEVGATPQVAVESNSMVALVAHVLTGRWSSVVPMELAAMVAAGPRLVSIPLVSPEVEHLVGLVAPGREMQTPVLAALIAAAERLAER